MAAEPPLTWSRAQRVLHWTLAALVLLAAVLALSMVSLSFRHLLLKFVLYQLHKTIGLTVFLLTFAQLALHWRRGRPAWNSDLPDWQRRAAGTVHALLFGLLIGTPLLGYLVAATAPAQIPTLFFGVIPVPHVVGTHPAQFAVLRQLHLAVAVLLLLLAGSHAGMAVHHQWQGRRTLARMWRG